MPAPIDQMEMLNLAMSNALGEFWAIDTEMRVLFWNKQMELELNSILGIEVKKGMSLPEAFSSIGLDEIATYYKSLYARVLGGEKFMLEVNTPVDGKIFYREQHFSPLLIDGKVVGATIYGIDITERYEKQRELTERLDKETELSNELERRRLLLLEREKELSLKNQELEKEIKRREENEILLKRLQEFAKIGTFSYQFETNVFECSDSLLIINEIEPSNEVSILTLTEGVSKADLLEFQSNSEKLRQGGKPFSYEFPKQLRSGARVWQKLYLTLGRSEQTGLNCLTGFVFDITETKLAELKLAESESKLSTIVEMSTDAIYDWDIPNDYIKWGHTTAAMYGALELSDFPVNMWAECIAESDRSRVLLSLQRGIDDPEISFWQEEYTIKMYTGGTRIVSDTGKFVRNENGQALRMIGGMRDISKLKQYEATLLEALDVEKRLNEQLSTREEELAASEEELLQLNEHLRVSLDRLSQREFLLKEAEKEARLGNWQFSVSSGEGTWSENMFIIFGNEPYKDVVSFNYARSFFNDEQLKKYNQALQDCKNIGRSFDIELLAELPSNMTKCVRMAGQPVFANSKVVAIRGITQDITYYKEIEKRVRYSEEKFFKAFNLSPDSINLVRQSDLSIKDTNLASEQLFGYTRDELLGSKTYELDIWVEHTDRDFFIKEFGYKGQVSLFCKLKRKNGSSFESHFEASELVIGEEAYMLIVARDLSKIAHFEELIRLKEENLQNLLNSNPFYIWSLDKDLRFVEVNKRFSQLMIELYGSSPEIGLSISDLPISPSELEDWVALYQKALLGSHVYVEKTFDKRTIEYHIYPVFKNAEITGVCIYSKEK